MTPPTRGWKLARDAALSLALTHDFTRSLANPRQMQPYTYADSPLTLHAARDSAFSGGPVCGSAAPNPVLPDGSHLLDYAGLGLTAVVFMADDLSAAQSATLDALRACDTRLAVVMIGGDASRPAIIARAGMAVFMTPSQPRRAAFICCGQTFMSLAAGTPPCPSKSSPPHARFWERPDHSSKRRVFRSPRGRN